MLQGQSDVKCLKLLYADMTRYLQEFCTSDGVKLE